MIVLAKDSSQATLEPLIWVFAVLFGTGILLLVLTSLLSLINRRSRTGLAESIAKAAQTTMAADPRRVAAEAVSKINHQVLYRAITIGSLAADPDLRLSVLDNRAFLTLPLVAADQASAAQSEAAGGPHTGIHDSP